MACSKTNQMLTYDMVNDMMTVWREELRDIYELDSVTNTDYVTRQYHNHQIILSKKGVPKIFTIKYSYDPEYNEIEFNNSIIFTEERLRQKLIHLTQRLLSYCDDE